VSTMFRHSPPLSEPAEFCIRSSQSLRGSRDASEEGEHRRAQGAGRQVLFEPDELRKHACDRLAQRLSVKAVTLYN
ncbi:MAG: hypothetical protein ABMA25_28500, partial [Ilumatobacteraceae bacterium]